MSLDGIRVTIISATNLWAEDPNGTSDPFVEFRVHGKKYKTSVIKRCLDPQWNEPFVLEEVIDLTNDSTNTIVFHIYDWDRWTKNDQMGKVVVDLNTFEFGKIRGFPILNDDGDSQLGENGELSQLWFQIDILGGQLYSQQSVPTADVSPVQPVISVPQPVVQQPVVSPQQKPQVAVGPPPPPMPTLHPLPPIATTNRRGLLDAIQNHGGINKLKHNDASDNPSPSSNPHDAMRDAIAARLSKIQAATCEQIDDTGEWSRRS